MSDGCPEAAGAIKAIDKHSVHQICSGQVVLTLATAVKELVENSIDAGATSVDVRLKDSGVELVEVSDNGKGVEEANFEGLTLKHHTSKLRDFSDLVRVETFGFRGEALSSLCALSNLSVVTCHESSQVGTKLVFDHRGHLVQRAPHARQQGTTVSLQQLFHTLPVRHKEFQRNIKKEFARMIHVLQSYCVVSAGVRITCSNQSGQGRRSTVLSSAGSLSMRDNIAAVFGAKQLQTLVPFQQKRPTENVVEEFGLADADLPEQLFTISGLVSQGEHGVGRSATDRQFFFINKRPCDPLKVSRLVNEVYHTYNRHQYPFVALNVAVASERVDVNVTPDKRQVFLQEEKLLLATLKTSLVAMYEGGANKMRANATPGGADSASSPELRHVAPAIRRHDGSAAAASPRATLNLAGLKAAFSNRHGSKRSADNPPGRGATQKTLRGFFAGAGRPAAGGFPRGSCESVTTGHDSRFPRTPDRRAEASLSHRDSASSPQAKRPRAENPGLDNPEFENPGLDNPGLDNPGLDAPGLDAPGLDAPGLDAPGLDAPGLDNPGLENPGLDDPGLDDPGLDAPGLDNPGLDNPGLDAPGLDAPGLDAPGLDAPGLDDPGLDAPGLDDPGLDDPGLDAPGLDDPGLDDPGLDDPGLDAPGLDAPGLDDPGLENPGLENPGLDDPGLDAPGLDNPGLDNPGLDAPGLDDPGLENPGLENPGLDAPARRRRRTAPLHFSLQTVALNVRRLRERRRLASGGGAAALRFRRFRAQISPGENQSAEEELRKEISKDSFREMEVIGQFNLGFIVTKLQSDVFIIDQHAADEKFNFEMLQRNDHVRGQRLIAPQALSLTAVGENVLMENMEIFKKNGFDFLVDENAPATRRVKLLTLPTSKNWSFGPADVDELVFMLSDSPGVMCRPSRVRQMFASRACRKSVMVGTALSSAEMKKLVVHMGEMEHPWNCPHGRPTMRHLVDLDVVSHD